jgi:hypothetical protein
MQYFAVGGNERSYFQWLQKHPHGYVIEHAGTGGRIHRAKCGAIGPNKANLNKHGKRCEITYAAAVNWSNQNGGPRQPCQRCNPP